MALHVKAKQLYLKNLFLLRTHTIFKGLKLVRFLRFNFSYSHQNYIYLIINTIKAVLFLYILNYNVFNDAFFQDYFMNRKFKRKTFIKI